MGQNHHHCRGGVPSSCKRTAPFTKPSTAGPWLMRAFFRKVNPNYSRPRIIEPANLDRDARRTFWRGDVRQKGLRTSALNGWNLWSRLSKNVVAAAHALVTKRGTRLSHCHLQQVVETSEKFIREFYSVHVIHSLYN
jgi:hypothetical protein